MAGEVSTIQSLKAVDAWIDVINANINGGVRTAFKSSRLKFSGSNTDVQRAGGVTSLPLQFPEPGLTTANTLTDWTQGAITASTENTHLAIQGDSFFMLISPDAIGTNGNFNGAPGHRLYVTRDGEFRTDQRGFLVHSSGLVLVTIGLSPFGADYSGSGARAVYNDLDNPGPNATATSAVKLSDFIAQRTTATTLAADNATPLGATNLYSLVRYPRGKDNLQYTSFGSTVFWIGYQGSTDHFPTLFQIPGTSSDATILNKSLEASNASMTQSVPELSLAQKLFSALTKVLQTKQTNVDGVLNLVR